MSSFQMTIQKKQKKLYNKIIYGLQTVQNEGTYFLSLCFKSLDLMSTQTRLKFNNIGIFSNFVIFSKSYW